MAKDIGGAQEPGMEGTKVGSQIQTPMMPANVGRQNTPSILTYGSTMNTNSGGGSSTIAGPGKKGSL